MATSYGQAGKSFLNIGLDNSAVSGPTPVAVTILPSNGYTPDPTVVLNSPTGPAANSPGMTAVKTNLPAQSVDSFSIKNIRVIINKPCFIQPANVIPTPLIVKSDVWSTNGQSVSKAHCWVGGITQGYNDPLITARKPCSSPRTYTLNISTTSTTPTTLTYSIYIDVDGNNAINNVGQPGGDIEIVPPTQFANFSSSNPYFTPVPQAYPPYSNTPGIADKKLIFRASTPLIANEIVTQGIATDEGCIPLPVDFKSFTATRNRSSVLLKWETSSEINNSGFAVERNVNGTWEQIAFVNSQAANGNSDALLTYTYSDMNNAKGITQYRIKQVDFDNKSKYTEIRSVRGLDQIGKVTVYPNPTSNGTVNVVFDDASVARTISVMDMSGRTLKQINNVTNNNITIDNLQPGMYTLRILVPETGEQTVQKIVVNKR